MFQAMVKVMYVLKRLFFWLSVISAFAVCYLILLLIHIECFITQFVIQILLYLLVCSLTCGQCAMMEITIFVSDHHSISSIFL